MLLSVGRVEMIWEKKHDDNPDGRRIFLSLSVDYNVKLYVRRTHNHFLHNMRRTVGDILESKMVCRRKALKKPVSLQENLIETLNIKHEKSKQHWIIPIV